MIRVLHVAVENPREEANEKQDQRNSYDDLHLRFVCIDWHYARNSCTESSDPCECI